MNLQKSLQRALAEKGYRSQKDFCETKGVSPSILSRLNKNNPNTKIGTILTVASNLDMGLGEFIALGEK